MGDEYTTVFWRITINGQELDDARRSCIRDVNITTRCNGSDTLSFSVSDPDFIYIEDNIFIEETTVTCEMWWQGDTHIVQFKGYISAVDPTFPEDGTPTLSCFCIDEGSHRMGRKKKNRSWDNVTRPDVIKKISAEYGLRVESESGYNFTREDNIAQSGQTDMEFLESLAGQEREPFMCKVKDGVIYYKKLGTMKSPSMTLSYKRGGCEIRSFSPQINKETRQEEIKQSNINTRTGKVETGTATTSNTPRDIQGEPGKTSSNPVEDLSRVGYDFMKGGADTWSITE